MRRRIVILRARAEAEAHAERLRRPLRRAEFAELVRQATLSRVTNRPRPRSTVKALPGMIRYVHPAVCMMAHILRCFRQVIGMVAFKKGLTPGFAEACTGFTALSVF